MGNTSRFAGYCDDLLLASDKMWAKIRVKKDSCWEDGKIQERAMLPGICVLKSDLH